MYLVQECGPTTFLIKEALPEDGQEEDRESQQRRRGGDRGNDRKYKVQIGGLLGCSCKSKQDGACRHLLFVLLKLLRMSSENPLAWQAALLDNEVEQVLRGRYNPIQDVRRRTQPERPSGERPSVEQKPIEEGDVCAICQEDMVEVGREPLTFCRLSCGNSVHAKCMKVWAEHKSSTAEKVTCPLCREDWGPLAMEELKKELRRTRRPPNVHTGVRCAACRGAPVTGPRYRCVSCIDTDLCGACFNRGVHAHHTFVAKPTVDAEWATAERPPPPTHPAPAAGAPAGLPPGLSADFIAGLQSRELTVEDYDALLALDGPRTRPLHAHLAAALRAPAAEALAAAGARGDGLCALCRCALHAAADLRELPCGEVSTPTPKAEPPVGLCCCALRAAADLPEPPYGAWGGSRSIEQRSNSNQKSWSNSGTRTSPPHPTRPSFPPSARVSLEAINQCYGR